MPESLPRWSDAAYAALESVLRKRSGLIFQPLRRATVEAAAGRVMRNIGVNHPDDFVPLVEQGGAVFDDLMAEVTIGETYFFREAAHFTLLRKIILPNFQRRQIAGQKFRVWSAACSTGEEPYSIAMALREEEVPGMVVGTDISRARLAAARRGEYRQWSFRGVPESTIARNFTRNGDTYTLSATIRRDVEFRYLNLASDAYPEMSSGVWGMDAIFCRNVLIYFDRDTIAHVAESLLASLAEDGWLLLGATDPPLSEFVKCEVVQTDAGLVYRRFRGTSMASVRSHASAAPSLSARVIPPVEPVRAAAVPSATADSGLTHAPVPASAAPPTETAAQAYVRRDYERTIALVAPEAGSGEAAANDFVLYIRALANLGRLEEAGRACATALDRHRENPELHYLHAVLIAQGGDFVESARAAKRALYLDRSMIVAHLALGSALAGSGDFESALRAFASSERLLGAMPADATVPGTDGEPAGRLLEMTRVQAKLARREGAA